MTAPIASGFPDFGRFQAQATKLYAKLLSTGNVFSFSVDLGYVGDIAHLGVNITVPVGACVVSLDFGMQTGAVQATGNHTFSMRANDHFARTLPVLGPYCVVTFFYTLVTFDVDYTFFQAAWPYSSLFNSSSFNVLAAAEGVAIGVGNTVVDCTAILPGPAVLFAALPAVVSSVTVYSVTASGVQTFLTRVFGNNIEAERQLYLPGQHIRLQLSNAGPGSQNFTYSLTADILRS